MSASLAPVRVKICGLTSAADMKAAVAAGADAVGLVFYPFSKRHVDFLSAEIIARYTPTCVSLVGLFVNPSQEEVEAVLRRVPLDQLQFHGSEADAFCRSFGRRFIKAVPMNDLDDGTAVLRYLDHYPSASSFLLDSFGTRATGGSGKRFLWEKIPTTVPNLIIAGGLNGDNVAELLQRFRPYAVDVSSGVESAPGQKSSDKMRAFIQTVKNL